MFDCEVSRYCVHHRDGQGCSLIGVANKKNQPSLIVGCPTYQELMGIKEILEALEAKGERTTTLH